MKKVGRKKIGKYVVDLSDELGHGSCAKVCRGTNSQTNQQVAVKIIDKAQIQQDEYMKNAFYQEIRIMMKLKSPNIIGFLDVNQTKSNFYIILEIATGSLKDLLQQRKKNKQPLTENQTIKYLVQLLNGFGAMFKFGVIHRDIKPDNIFTKDDKLKIGDFGFAKNNQQLDSMMSTIVGSPAYMAPQILKKEKYTYKCDIWSLGVMTYEMLVGELPFDYKKVEFSKDFDKDRKEIYRTVMQTEIKYPPHVKISQNMQSFIKGCLQPRQEDRFDWMGLFLHPIFKGLFQNNFSNMKKGEELVAYIMGELRMIFNQYNVDIIAQLEKLKKTSMSVKEFTDFLQYLNCDITEEETTTLTEILKKNDSVNLKDFQKLMEIHDCLPTTKPLSNQSIMLADKKRLSLVINLIKKAHQLKPINFNELVPKEIMTKEKLSLEDFSKIVKSLAPQVPDHVLPDFKQIVFQSREGESIPIPLFISVIEDIVKENNVEGHE